MSSPVAVTTRRRHQLQFLCQSARLEESGMPAMVRGVSFIFCLGLFALLIWSAFATIQEVASAPGEVAPKGLPQTVQSYDGGIVYAIHVEDGAQVQAGDVLLALDGTGAREELRRAQAQETGLAHNRDIAEQLYSIQKSLDAMGHTSRVRVLESEKALNDADSALAQQRETIARQTQLVNRLEVRAPLTGIVKGLKINTIGAVVRSGEALMEIVPLNRPLVVQARIKPQDIGYIRVGQSVKVKVSSFDFARYGTVDGRLDFISATTFSDERGEPYYRGRIGLSRNYLGDDRRRRILPGMIVQAGIFTGEKTVLSYLFKPIQRAFAQSLTER